MVDAISRCNDQVHWTCIAHIITAVIGSGVLALAWGVAQLGWIVGPVSMLVFAFVTFVSVYLLADCYRSPDSVHGARNHTYMDAVRVRLGCLDTLFFFMINLFACLFCKQWSFSM